MEPADLAARLEREAGPLHGPGERFRGYGVLGLLFADGDLLAMRRFPSTSGDSAYTSVWHRSRDTRWTFYTDIGWERGCPRYFGPAIGESIVTPIRVEWVSARRLAVSIDGGRLLKWTLCVSPSVRSRVLTSVAGVIPTAYWAHAQALRTVECITRALLGTGRFRLVGATPSGHGFRVTPRAVWHVRASRARFCGRDLGALVPLAPQVALADFWVPRRGLFVAADVDMSEPKPLGPADP